MLSVDEFKSLPEWKAIEKSILDEIAIHTDACVSYSSQGNLSATFEAGILKALTGILKLPDEVLASSDDKREVARNKKTSIGEILIASGRY